VTIYKATGVVLGYYWGGGKGTYSSRVTTSDTLEGVLKKANAMLADGSLDSGMGYESLIGAILEIEIKDTIIINEKEYSSYEYVIETIGDLTEEEIDFLTDVINKI